MLAPRPLYSSVNKDKETQFQREYGGVGFVCANQLHPCSQIWAHLRTSSPGYQGWSSRPSLVLLSLQWILVLREQHLQVEDSLVGTWKSRGMCPLPSIFQRTTKIWLDGGLCFTNMRTPLTHYYVESSGRAAYIETPPYSPTESKQLHRRLRKLTELAFSMLVSTFSIISNFYM